MEDDKKSPVEIVYEKQVDLVDQGKQTNIGVLRIENHSKATSVTCTKLVMCYPGDRLFFKDKKGENTTYFDHVGLEIPAGHQMKIVIYCNSSQPGVNAQKIHVYTNLKDWGVYSVDMECSVGDHSINDLLKETSPYVKPVIKRIKAVTDEETRKGPKPRGYMKYPLELKPYPIPSFIMNEPDSDKAKEAIMDPILHFDNYSSKFQHLLWIEENRMRLDIRTYDLREVSFIIKDSQTLSLKVPGLAEKRPSVLYGDAIKACFSNEKKYYTGYIHIVELDSVDVKFHQAFHKKYFNGTLCDIVFEFSRLPLKRMHRAVETVSKFSFLKRIILPNHNDVPQSITPPTIENFNRDLNEEQVRAVSHILKHDQSKGPYLLYGPPGTGKTSTLVEAIKQVYWGNPQSRILVIAPSNTAVDLIVSRILNAGTRKAVDAKTVIRLNSIQRSQNKDLPKGFENCLKDVSNFENTEDMKFSLGKMRIIATTCVTAGVLQGIEMERGHFSHIFSDEAGHATEPEMMIPISAFADDKTSVVLAGDPQQLGPIIRSITACKYGLDKSLLQRLIQLEYYNKDPILYSETYGYPPERITKLVKNYRSHESILRLPSDLFYSSELVPCVNSQVASEFCQWNDLPNKGFPFLFHGVVGKDTRESTSPSWFNISEIEQTLTYIKSLLYQFKGLRLEDFGIIAPYRKQVEKFRTQLRKDNLQNVKVGSVEEFQGQEFKVVILSTVRSSPAFLPTDKLYNLGFLTNYRRLNVAITRAKCLLIIIGNPYVLNEDPYWRKLLRYCLDGKSFVGIGKFDYSSSKEKVQKIIDEAKAEKLDGIITEHPITRHET